MNYAKLDTRWRQRAALTMTVLNKIVPIARFSVCDASCIIYSMLIRCKCSSHVTNYYTCHTRVQMFAVADTLQSLAQFINIHKHPSQRV